MIVFRPNVQSYMPGADIVNRPVVAAAASGWWLADGTIDAGNVMQTEENVESASYSGSALGATWTWVCKFTAPDDTGASVSVFDSSANDLADYVFQIRDDNNVRFLIPAGITSTNPYTPGLTVIFVVCDESGDGLSVYQDNSLILNFGSPGTGEWANGADLLFSDIRIGTANLLAIYDVALDSTQRAALYASMSA